MGQDLLDNLIDQTVVDYCKRKGVDVPESFGFEIIVTRDPSHGDFASNVAFKLAKLVHEKPALIADELVLIMEEGKALPKAEAIDRFQVAGGGFINFYMAKGSVAEVLLEVIRKGKEFGKSDFGKGVKVLLEFVSANPTGPLTIAHGRQAAIGDSLARILCKSGHEVITEYYLNDGGRQMGLLGASLWARYGQELGMDKALPEDGYQGAYLVDLAKKLIAEKNDSLLKETEEKAVEVCRVYAMEAMMADIRADLKTMRVSFDSYYSEQTLYKKGHVTKALDYLSEKKQLFEEDGALWFRSTDYGDDKDRVVRKSSGDFTYLAPDIAYHRQKFERGCNRLINLWGPDHHGYIARLKAACQALGYDASQVEIRIVQLTTLYRKGEPVRMSTRAGEFVTLRELYEEVGVDATRFFFIMRRVESHLDFDLDLARQKSQDNPVYYLQYAHARISGILRNAEQPVPAKADLKLLSSEEETNLIKVISEYPKAVVSASEFMEPYRVADYLRDLAVKFHKFYSLHRVLGDDPEVTKARLLLSEATRIVLKGGLEVLGISQPESM